MGRRSPSRDSARAGGAPERVEVEVTGFAHGGLGVARLDGKVVFVQDAIPGERVVAEVTAAKRSWARAVAVDVLEASQHRVPHVWPEAGIDRPPAARAGGADLGHVALAHQRELKALVLRDAMARFGGVDADRLDRVVDGPLVRPASGDDAVGGLGTRTRVRLRAGEDGRLGPMAARSHRVIAVERLPLAAAGMDAVLDIPFDAGTSVRVVSVGGEVRLVVGEQAPTTIVETVRTGRGSREFRVDDTGFWQVHAAAPAELTGAVQAALAVTGFDPRADNLDLYGGVGLLAAAMAEAGGPATRVTSVEADERATLHAGENLAEWVGARAESGRVDAWLTADRRLGGATVVLDPPRSGAGLDVASRLADSGAAALVYVACDPVALARDTRAIEGRGFRLARLEGIDLFPHTHHLEAVAAFVRA